MPVFRDDLSLEVGDWVWRDDHNAVGRVIDQDGQLLILLYFSAASGGTGFDYTERRAASLYPDSDYLITAEEAWRFREDLGRLLMANLPAEYATRRFGAYDYPGERWARSGLPLEDDWSTQGLFQLAARELDHRRAVEILYHVVFGRARPWP